MYLLTLRCRGQWTGFAATDMPEIRDYQAGVRVAFVAAMEREVARLVADWRCLEMDSGGIHYKIFQSGDAFLICGGIGVEPARRATEIIIQKVHPERVLSVGF